MLPGLVRKALGSLLAALPRNLHQALDAWSQALARQSAQRRRQRLLRRQAAKA